MDTNQPILAIHVIKHLVDVVLYNMEKGSPIFAACIPAGQIVIDAGQLLDGSFVRKVSAYFRQDCLKFTETPLRNPIPEEIYRIEFPVDIHRYPSGGRSFFNRKGSVRNLYRLTEFVQRFMPYDLSCFVVEDPAHHACFNCKVQGSIGASHHSQAMKFLHSRITPLFFRADDTYEVLSVVIKQGDIGSQQGWVDNVEPFNHPPIGIDPATEILIGTIRRAFKLPLLNLLEPLPA